MGIKTSTRTSTGTPTTTKRLNVELDEEIYHALRILCVTQNTTVADKIRGMVAEELKRAGQTVDKARTMNKFRRNGNV